MKYDSYPDLEISKDFSVIDFISEGKKGSIPKRIEFTPTELKHVYNLAFGDVNENGELDDSITSDNGDRNRILATVASVVQAYTIKYPERWIAFSGSTKERTRLYRMAMGLNFEELSAKFDIYVYGQNGIVPFSKNMEINVF